MRGLVALGFALTSLVGCAPPTVFLASGSIRGEHLAQTWAFRGIPYAAPPVGPLRFAPPRPLQSSATREARQFGPCCPQLEGNGVVGDEDCLTLNVWTPGVSGARRPVLVFLHGGGNTNGCSASTVGKDHVYEGDALAEAGDVVVVTLNYRLGVLGFLAHDALGPASSNLGLRDQQAALRWIQTNIVAFGGDPARVLLFGESSGATDVCAHLLSPASAGLFSRAIMESGDCAEVSHSSAQKQAETLAEELRCGSSDVAACLRARSVGDLLRASEEVEWGPVIDGDLLIEAPEARLAKGLEQHVPLIIGDNSAELLLFVRGVPIPDEAAYRAQLGTLLSDGRADKVMRHYPVSAYRDAKSAYVAAIGDARFVCPARSVARLVASAQSEPVYRYLFTHALMTTTRPRDDGATHGLELLFLFGHLSVAGYRPSPAEVALSWQMMGEWARFAATGNPNVTGRADWQPYAAAADNYWRIDEKSEMGAQLHSANCDFWDRQ